MPQNTKAITTVITNEMGMAIFAGTRNPTNNTAAEIIGNTASNAKIEGDIFLINN